MPRGVKGFIKGRKKTGGRKIGTPNKFTTLRDAFIDAFKELGAAQGLIKWVEADVDNQRAFYSLIARMLPAEMRVRETTPPGLKLSMSALRASTIIVETAVPRPGAARAEDLRARPGPSKDPEQMSDEELEAAIREEERKKNVHAKRPHARKTKKRPLEKSPGRKTKARKG